jgi:phage terminase large subunit-like protein
VLELAQRFRVRKVFFDPYQMQATAQRLTRAGVSIDEFPQTSASLTEISQGLYELILGRNLQVYRDDAIRLAVSRAVAIETSRGWRITKEKQSHRIDIVIALAMACRAAIERGERRVGWQFFCLDGRVYGEAGVTRPSASSEPHSVIYRPDKSAAFLRRR